MLKRSLFVDDFLNRRDFSFRLRIVISRSLKMKTNEAKAFLTNIKDEDDNTILKQLNSIQSLKKIPETTESHISHLVKGIYGNFCKLFEREQITKKCEKYLDIGCNDGNVTRSIAKYFGTNKNETFGLDITDSVFPKNKEYFNFHVYDGTSIPFGENEFNVVTVFQVFHHVGVTFDGTCNNSLNMKYDETQLFMLIKNIVSVMKNGGLLFIKEHDCDSELMTKLIDIEHILYDMRYNSGIGVGKYRTKDNWNELLNTFGFMLDRIFIDDTNDPTNSFYAVYKLTK